MLALWLQCILCSPLPLCKRYNCRYRWVLTSGPQCFSVDGRRGLSDGAIHRSRRPGRHYRRPTRRLLTTVVKRPRRAKWRVAGSRLGEPCIRPPAAVATRRLAIMADWRRTHAKRAIIIMECSVNTRQTQTMIAGARTINIAYANREKLPVVNLYVSIASATQQRRSRRLICTCSVSKRYNLLWMITGYSVARVTTIRNMQW